jgi:rsbT antagonist protein RsbS
MAGETISVVKVRDILMVTIPPDPEDETVTALQEKVLAAMEKYGAKGLILDIATVETLDSFFARTILETARMVALMGGKTIIAGMRTSVAITATQLGLSFGRTLTALNVDRALDMVAGGAQEVMDRAHRM